MKNLLYFLVPLILIFSCSDSYYNETSDIKTSTIIKGNVSDLERGFPIENFKIVFNRYWDGWSVVQYARKKEFIDSVRTDSNGNYKIVFDFIKGEEYGFEAQYYGMPYYTEFINPKRIKEGKENIQNINAWYPTILKLNLKVTNNENPALRISNEIIGNSNFISGGDGIYKREVDITIYLRTKPNSKIKLNMTYSTGTRNEDFHFRNEFLTTDLRDTIELSYDIDCKKF